MGSSKVPMVQEEITLEDKLESYFAGELEEQELTEDEIVISKRVLDMWSTLRNKFYAPTQAVKAHFTRLKNINQEISFRTAWRDYKMATRIFGDRAMISREAMFRLAYEHSLVLLQKAIRTKNLTEQNRAFKNHVEVIKHMPSDIRDAMRPTAYIFNVKMSNGESKEINMMDFPDVEDTQFEEIMEIVDGQDISDDDMKALLSNEGNS